jgi:lysozyme-like protein
VAAQTLTMGQVVALWIKAGGSIGSAPSAVAHAWAESSGRTGVTSANPDGGTNVGLFQLDTKGVGAGHTVTELQDPLVNTQLAVKGSHDGSNWGPWPDAWRSFITDATTAADLFAENAATSGGLSNLADDVLKGVKNLEGDAASAVGSAAAAVFTLPSQVTDFFSQAETFARAALWIVDPQHWARIIAAMFGALLGGLGLYALAKAA